MTVEDDYFYSLCDKYGILVIQDFPCGGEHYRVPVHIYPTLNAKIFNHERFCTLKWHGRENIDGQTIFLTEALMYTKNLNNFPSVIMYTIFNESWGQFDASNVYELLKKCVGTSRLLDTTSGWLKADRTDVYSVHSYSFYWKNRQDKKTHKPFLLSEFGGTSLKVDKHFYYPKVYGHGVVQDYKELNEAYKKQYTRIIKLMTKGHLKGCIYTQFNDCETECNGIYTLDRSVLKLDEKLVKDLNSKINDLNK
jgi:beta-galactosidase/beta-glucuronidase